MQKQGKQKVIIERGMISILTESRLAEEKIWWIDQRNCIKLNKSMQSQLMKYFLLTFLLSELAINLGDTILSGWNL